MSTTGLSLSFDDAVNLFDNNDRNPEQELTARQNNTQHLLQSLREDEIRRTQNGELPSVPEFIFRLTDQDEQFVSRLTIEQQQDIIKTFEQISGSPVTSPNGSIYTPTSSTVIDPDNQRTPYYHILVYLDNLLIHVTIDSANHLFNFGTTNSSWSSSTTWDDPTPADNAGRLAAVEQERIINENGGVHPWVIPEHQASLDWADEAATWGQDALVYERTHRSRRYLFSDDLRAFIIHRNRHFIEHEIELEHAKQAESCLSRFEEWIRTEQIRDDKWVAQRQQELGSIHEAYPAFDNRRLYTAFLKDILEIQTTYARALEELRDRSNAAADLALLGQLTPENLKSKVEETRLFKYEVVDGSERKHVKNALKALDF